MLVAPSARYAVLADDAWAREIARRETILTTYDAHETGVVEDLINGGANVASGWFNSAHPCPLRMVMEMLAWQPELFGPARENHIMRTTSVVSSVQYGKGRIAYRSYDGLSPSEDVLRLAFAPPRSRPTASPCRDLRSCRKTATRSSPWPTAIFSCTCATTAAATC